MFLILLTIALTIFIKTFLIASFKIPTPSMDPAILPGDHILINKLIIGPRLYQNTGFLRGNKVQFVRLQGIRPICRNDILVFNFPYPTPEKLEPDLNIYLVKRCLGVPGDTFSIEKGMYKVQGYPEPLGLYHRQTALNQMSDDDFSSDVFHCFPFDTAYHWNIKDFGPLYIPGKGDRITLNTRNIVLYKNLIRYETDQEIQLKENEIYLGDSLCSSYTFTQNYYFMAGDWIFDSRDSRYWGLLPEDLIVGKAVTIWKSKDPHSGKFRWDRFFNPVK